MATAVLAYRRPRTLDTHERSVAQAIAVRERAYQAAAWAMLLIGIVALFVGPAVLAGAAVGVESRMHVMHALSWWAMFGIVCAAVVPLLFWLENRTRGQWFEEELRGGSGATISQALFAPMTSNIGVGAAAIVEIMLWGPRLVIGARQRWKTRVATATLHDAAAIIGFLRHFDGGVAVNELPTVQPLRVMGYLVSRDWVGVSKDGQRVWLLGDAKKI
jgi:hypothetical protein